MIVDDSSRFLDAARVALDRDGITVVGVASNTAQALRGLSELQPDVVLLDIDLGGESGFEVARQLQHSGPARVILISTHDETDYADLIALSPAVGFVPKTRLSVSAVRHLLDRSGGPEHADRVNGPRGI